MTVYQKLTVWYFSGTGNSRNVASWLADTARENNLDNQLINIANTDRFHIQPADPDALVAFVSPVHGFNYPPVMLHFIMRFPKGKNCVVLMNTRAGMLIGKFITPGLSGITFYLAALILWLKGYTVKSMFPIDLPSNWMSIHPGLNERTVKYLHEKNKAKVTAFATKIFSGKSDFRSLHEIIQDTIAAPLSIGYYFIGHFFFAKTFYASADCTKCDICIKGCPVKAIITIDKRPFWTFNCESCMKCMSTCPERAIETAHGSITVFLFAFYSVLLVSFYRIFAFYFFTIENRLAIFILNILLILVALGLWYRLIHYLMHFKFFERLIVYTSLTKFKFWGRRYKAIKD